MTKKWLWLTIGAVAAVGFVAGLVVAQEPPLYPYLPEKYSLAYVPTLAEWSVLHLTARQNNEAYLTSRLIKKSCTATALGSHLRVQVETETQAGWNTYLGKGRFSCSDQEVRTAYEEAADGSAVSIIDWVRLYFAGISDENVRIHFRIRGDDVGTWQGGKMTLEGEE